MACESEVVFSGLEGLVLEEEGSPSIHLSAWGAGEQETQDWASFLDAGMDTAFVFFFPEAAIFMSIVLETELQLVSPRVSTVCACYCLLAASWPPSSNENNTLTRG